MPCRGFFCFPRWGYQFISSINEAGELHKPLTLNPLKSLNGDGRGTLYIMNEELIRELMKDIEGMAMQIESEWGSPFTTLEELVNENEMPSSYYKLLELLAPYEALFTVNTISE